MVRAHKTPQDDPARRNGQDVDPSPRIAFSGILERLAAIAGAVIAVNWCCTALHRS